MKSLVASLLVTIAFASTAFAGNLVIRETADRIFVEYTGNAVGAAPEIVVIDARGDSAAPSAKADADKVYRVPVATETRAQATAEAQKRRNSARARWSRKSGGNEEEGEI